MFSVLSKFWIGKQTIVVLIFILFIFCITNLKIFLFCQLYIRQEIELPYLDFHLIELVPASPLSYQCLKQLSENSVNC